MYNKDKDTPTYYKVVHLLVREYDGELLADIVISIHSQIGKCRTHRQRITLTIDETDTLQGIITREKAQFELDTELVELISGKNGEEG